MSATADEFRWLLDGEVGSSSMTIWHVMTGEAMRRHWIPSPPLDPDDLRRCMKLLDRFPAWRSRLREVAEVYPEWDGLVFAWAQLETMLTEELKATPGIAPVTYAFMRRIENATRGRKAP